MNTNLTLGPGLNVPMLYPTPPPRRLRFGRWGPLGAGITNNRGGCSVLAGVSLHRLSRARNRVGSGYMEVALTKRPRRCSGPHTTLQSDFAE